jgi:hypothetical protein
MSTVAPAGAIGVARVVVEPACVQQPRRRKREQHTDAA